MSMNKKILKQQKEKTWREKNPEKIKGYMRNWYLKNKKEILRKQKERNLKNPEKRYLTNRKSDLRKYGLTLEQYDEMEKVQKMVCAICGKKQKDKKLAVDHCHKKGHVRGLLCSFCNQGLGKFRDDTKLLSKAIKYLNKNI